jgi:polyphosphate kinase
MVRVHTSVAPESGSKIYRRHAATLFPGATIESVHMFRLIRDADRRSRRGSNDLLRMIEEHVRQTPLWRVVSLTVNSAMPAQAAYRADAKPGCDAG